MAKRSKKSGSSLGTMILRIVFVAVLSFGIWYGWRLYHGEKPELPKLAELDSGSIKDLARKVASEVSPGPSAAPASETESTKEPPPAVQTNQPPARTNQPAAEEPEHQPRQLRNVRNALDAQIALARKGISVGPIDGAAGENMRRALLAWQIHNGLPVSGELDAESKEVLLVEEPLMIQYAVSEADLQRLMKVPAGWLAKSKADRLDYETILELLAERGRASQAFIRKINPGINWTNVTPGTLIQIPRIDPPPVTEKAAFVRVHLYSKTLDVFGRATNLIAHYPCSIASRVEKRPVGALQVANAAANPTYLFDPAVFKESAEARKIGRKLNIPAGPNNPVGTAWIGLSRPGYGIHGTPAPEQVGRTESHGCFRLANWNAEHLLQLAWVGMPVLVEP